MRSMTKATVRRGTPTTSGKRGVSKGPGTASGKASGARGRTTASRSRGGTGGARRKGSTGTRLKKAPRRAPSSRGRLLAFGALLAALVGGLVFLFFFSAAFVVKDVTVAGVEGDLATSVEELADVPRGRPLAKVSEGRISDRVLQDLRISDLSVGIDWTSSTVTLEATPREPALVLTQGGRSWLSDVDGVVYDQVAKPSNKLPAVAVPEQPTDLGADTVRGLVELWRMRPDPAELEGDLATPRMDAKGLVTMKVDQLTILWGEPTETEKKWTIVTALIAQDSIDPQGGIPQTIDVSLPQTPVVTGIPPKG